MIDGEIEAIAFGGSGVMRHEGLVIFVPFSAPQDRVQVKITQQKKNHALGEIVKIEKPSPLRREPLCPLFRRCGGCQLQHLTYAAQLEAKQHFIESALARIGKISCEVAPVVPASEQWHYRRHIRLNLRKKGKGFEAGYIGCDGHSFLTVSHCPIFQQIGDTRLEALQKFLSELSSEGIEQGSLRLFKTEHNKWLLAFSFSPTLPSNRAEVISEPWSDITMQAPGKKESFGNSETSFWTAGLQIHYTPYGFVQNHPEQSEKLYQAILEKSSPKTSRLLDLYCGIGISSLLFAKAGKQVVGIESNPASVKLAEKNRDINGITGVRFVTAKAEEAIKQELQNFKPETILVNPPRTGLAPSLLEELLRSNAEEILYVSCMPATLARDLKALQARYTLTACQPFDMFPQTTHVETLVHLYRT